jgi:protein-S-isoprenylcysteine O-methyltransferase Ste14
MGPQVVSGGHLSHLGGARRHRDHPRGPYRFIRHPMYSAALLFIWAAVLGQPSTLTLTIGVAVTVVSAARIIAEERLLREAYPDYREYARTTKALVPFLF